MASAFFFVSFPFLEALNSLKLIEHLSFSSIFVRIRFYRGTLLYYYIDYRNVPNSELLLRHEVLHYSHAHTHTHLYTIV